MSLTAEPPNEPLIRNYRSYYHQYPGQFHTGITGGAEPHYLHPTLALNLKYRGGSVKLSTLLLTSLVGTVVACATKPTPVTVAGEPSDKASLAGKWSGEYQSSSTGRSGSIVFNLSPTGDAASGDVVMIPRGYGKALEAYTQAGNTGTPTTTTMQNTNNSQILTIKLVRVHADSVSGVLDAYRDPECDCPVMTTFTGTLSGDTLEGTYATRGSQSNAPQTGTWRVRRSR
jgi:hypothetical protein